MKNVLRRFGWLVLVLLVALIFFAWQRRPVAVEAVRLQPKSLAQSVVVTARVEAAMRVDLGATMTGRIRSVFVREGDTVAAGQVLAVLESDELQAALQQAQSALRSAQVRAQSQEKLSLPLAQSQWSQAQANYLNAQRDLERQKRLFAENYVSSARVDEAERAVKVALAQVEGAVATRGANEPSGAEAVSALAKVQEASAALALAESRLAQTKIDAPANGVVLDRTAEPGLITQAGKRLFVLRSGEPTLVAAVDEKFLGQLQVGQNASASADAFPAAKLDATVKSISPAVDVQRGTVEVKLSLKSPPEFLREDMTFSVAIETGAKADARVLPSAAVMTSQGKSRVQSIAEGVVIEKEVAVGLRTYDHIEITGGLEADAAVIRTFGVVPTGKRAHWAESKGL